MKAKTQVLIVGGGPAGSTAAYGLARQGFDVCLLEKHQMPRYKTCGGGVNVRAARLLPFDIEPVVERVISTYRFTYRGERSFERTYHQPLTYMTQRMNLDKYLLDQARAMGARTAEGVTVRKVESAPDQATVVTAEGDTYEADVVIGADGANSVVARNLGLMKDMRRELALESEIELTPAEMEHWNGVCEVDLFSLRCGYGWVFPKGQHVSIGVGGLQEQIKEIQQYNKEYLDRHGLMSRQVMRYSGHALPVRTDRSPLVHGRGLLVGDAAGLLEPFTGEGIGYAVRSGQLAATTIGAFLRGEVPNLDTYGERLDAEITPELLHARHYVNVFNRFPRLFYRMIRDSDYVWNAICLILRGDRHYADIDRRLGVFRHALALL
jgi:geranylgeranyl reductase family protein